MKKEQTELWNHLCRMMLTAVVILFAVMSFVMETDAGDEITGCANNSQQKYNGVFDPADFDLEDVAAGTGLTLETGKEAIDPNNIIVPKEQEVWATYFFEGAGYQSDFGWFLYADAVDDKDTEDKSDDTFIGWDALLKKHKSEGNILHPIFVKIIDDGSKEGDWETSNNSRGVFDKDYGTGGSFPYNDEDKLADITKYNDGSGVPFFVNGDGVVSPEDMRKSLGNGAKFAPGTEIVFFLASNHRWNASGKSGMTFFTKTDWNPDYYKMYWKYRLDRSNCDTTKNSDCADIFECFDNAADMDCIDKCDANDKDCINKCYNNTKLNACKEKVKDCLGTIGCSVDWWNITTTRVVPDDDEIAVAADDPGWLNFDRDEYSYTGSISHSINYNTNDKDKYYPGLVKRLEVDKTYFDPVDPPGDVGPAQFNRRFKLGSAGGESWKVDNGWLANEAVTRMNNIFGVYLSSDDQRVFTFTNGEKYPHVIVGAPKGDPDQWVLGWDDQPGTGWSDSDFNDMVFRIELEVMGVAQLVTEKAITPDDPELNYTAVSIRVKDYMPVCGAAKTNIDYYIALDGGVDDDSWIKVEWDTVFEYNEKNDTVGDLVENWEPGLPEYTYRQGRIDFAELGITGNLLVWKAELRSDNETCIPKIIDVEIEGDVARNAIFSRSSPTVRTNVVYSGTYETPAQDWEEKYMRGHVVATRTYDPSDPGEKTENDDGTITYGESKTDVVELWDAGAVLNTQEPSARKIYYPDIVYHSVSDENTGKRGLSKEFSGTLKNTVVQAGSIQITDGEETFYDKHTNKLEGDKGGTGWVNRFTGEFTITFSENNINKEVAASYKYYEMKETLKEFNTSNVNHTMLNLDDEYVISDDGIVYKNDLDGDGVFNETKDAAFLVNWTRGYKDGSSTKKPWILGAVDHSTPAVAHAPGKATWYDSLTGTEKDSYHKYMKENINRQTILLVGARDGMLHAFDAGHFRWYSDTDNVESTESGNNPKTSVQEYRGYFEWGEGTSIDQTDGDLYEKTYTYGTGEEKWAFIPANLMSRLKNNLKKAESQAYVDGAPAVAHVYVDGAWKSVVLSAQGNGGDTVFCLDITDPLNPKLMWEFMDPDLYRSKSSPAVGQIGKVMVNGKSQWVSFFVSGTPTNCDNNKSNSYCYPSVFMLDIADGRVISRIFLDSVEDGMGGVPSGQPAIVDLDGNGFLDNLYVGTDKGYMYKISIPDTSDASAIEECVINSKVEPIYASPTVVVSDTKDYVNIFFGTSDNPYQSGDNPPGTIYSFYAYKDASGKSGCSDVSLLWSLAMPAGHRIFATAFASAGKVYFGTSTQDTEDPCSAPDIAGAGPGRLYMVDQLTGDGEHIEVGNIRSAPVVDDQHLYFKTMDGDASGAQGDLRSIGNGVYNNKPNELDTDGTLSPQIKWWREVTKKESTE